MKPKRKRDFTGMFIMAVLLSFILPLGYLVVRIVSHGSGTEEVRSREDYVLMLLQCLLGIAAIVLPLRLIRQKTLQIPRVMLVLYIAFLYCAIFLGEVRSFYYAVPQWDTILHTMSGAMLGALGFSMIAIFNNAERIPLNLSPVFIAAFAFCFALALGAVWEIYEFTMDSVFGTNMQKYMLDNGTALYWAGSLAGHDEGHHRGRHRRTGDEHHRLHFPQVQKGLGGKADDPFSREKARKKRENQKGKG